MSEIYSNLLQNSSKWAKQLGFPSIFILTFVDGMQPQEDLGPATIVYLPLLPICAIFLAWLVPFMIRLAFNLGLTIKIKIFKNAKLSDTQVLYFSAILMSICLVELWLWLFWTPISIPQRTIGWITTLALLPIFSVFMGQLESGEDKINAISKEHTAALFKDTVEISLLLGCCISVFIVIIMAVLNLKNPGYLSIFAIFIFISVLILTQLLFRLILNILLTIANKISSNQNKKINSIGVLYLSSILFGISLFFIFRWRMGFYVELGEKIIYGSYILIPLISVMIVHIQTMLKNKAS